MYCRWSLLLTLAVGGYAGAALAQDTEPPKPSLRAEVSPLISQDPAFEVVSIRRSRPDEIRSAAGQVTADEYRAVGWPLGITIAIAYFPWILSSRDRFVGMPSWAWDDDYDFVAKIAPEEVPQWEDYSRHWGPLVQNAMLQQKLRTALAERCKLVVHRVPGKAAGYALVVSGGHADLRKLRGATGNGAVPREAQSIAEGGMMVPFSRHSDPVITFFHTSMASLAAELSDLIGVPVEDRTKLSGSYDFSLRRWDSDPDSNDMGRWDLGELGLKLERSKLPATKLVIDRIERPSPN